MRRIRRALPLVAIALLVGMSTFILYCVVAVAPNRIQEQRVEVADLTAKVADLTQEVHGRQKDEATEHLLAQALLAALNTSGPIIIISEKGPMFSVERNEQSGGIIFVFLE